MHRTADRWTVSQTGRHTFVVCVNVIHMCKQMKLNRWYLTERMHMHKGGGGNWGIGQKRWFRGNKLTFLKKKDSWVRYQIIVSLTNLRWDGLLCVLVDVLFLESGERSITICTAMPTETAHITTAYRKVQILAICKNHCNSNSAKVISDR